MAKLPLSWMPVRLLDKLQEGTLSVEDWIRSAPGFGLQGVEIHHTLLESKEGPYLDWMKRILDETGIKVSLVCCSPDFAHPDPSKRAMYLEEMKQNIQAARQLGAFGVRVTTGIRHPILKEEDGIRWVIDSLKRLADYAQPQNITLALENHYKDRNSGWKWPDFAQKGEVFLKIFEKIKDTPVMINFDCSNQIMIGENPIDVLNEVKEKVASIHASDRFVGSYQHSVVGEGAVPYDEILKILKEVEFNGWVSIEDGNPYGDEGFRKSVSNIKTEIAKIRG